MNHVHRGRALDTTPPNARRINLERSRNTNSINGRMKNTKTKGMIDSH